MDPSNELEDALASLFAGGNVEIREDGRRLAALEDAQYELRGGPKPLLHLWSGERTLARRVLRLVEADGDHLRLEIQRFGQSRPGRLELFRRSYARGKEQRAREVFAERIKEVLARQFPDETLESLTTAPDLEHTLSGSYARGWSRRGQEAWAVVAAAPGEDAATVDAALTCGLIWLDYLRARAVAPVVAGLRLVLPVGSCGVVAHRMSALGAGVAVELYQWAEDEPFARRVDPADVGNIRTRLAPRRQAERLLGEAAETDARIRALAPDAIDAVVVPGTKQVGWRFRGLEFARWSSGEVRFGLGPIRKLLSGENAGELERLVADLASRRQAGGDPRDALFRVARERWLETLVLADPARIEPRLDPLQVYSQVPAFSAGDRGVLDLLGVTREGRLVVVELKVEEDPQLVFQAVDYWLRVHWHLRQGDFERYGYFQGKTLETAPPLLYLVAPCLRFHSVTAPLLRFLSSEIPVCRIGLNEDWRHGLRVVERAWRA